MLSFHDKKVIARDTRPAGLELLYVVTNSRDNRSQPNHNAEGRPLWHARPGPYLPSGGNAPLRRKVKRAVRLPPPHRPPCCLTETPPSPGSSPDACGSSPSPSASTARPDRRSRHPQRPRHYRRTRTASAL